MALSLLLLLLSRAVFAFPILYAHNHWAPSSLTHQEIVIAWSDAGYIISSDQIAL